jgi:hypothetical protein
MADDQRAMMAGHAATTGVPRVTNMFAMLRLLPTSDRNNDIEVLALRHQIMVLQRQIGEQRPRPAWVRSANSGRGLRG